jgi:hypothetical protein
MGHSAPALAMDFDAIALPPLGHFDRFCFQLNAKQHRGSPFHGLANELNQNNHNCPGKQQPG